MTRIDGRDTKQVKYQVPALDKGLDILEALAFSSQPVTLSVLARQLNRSGSELFRLLAALEARGYINKNTANGTYTLSLRLYELAHQHPPEMNLLTAASVPMEAFARRTNESVHISVLRYGKMIVLKEVLNPGPVRLSVAVGGQFSPAKTSSGRLLLAQVAAEELAVTLQHSEDYLSLDRSQQREFQAKLDQIRKTGLSLAENENHMGVRDAAVIVGNPKVSLAAALASTWLTAVDHPTYTERIIQELRNCAEEITLALGLKND